MQSALGDTFGCVLTSESGEPLPDPASALRLFDTYGAVLFRGFPFTKEPFIEFSNACCARFSKYVGGGFRFRTLDRESKDASGTVMSTTGSTQSFAIPLHGEMYYQGDRPDMLWFFCDRAPAVRGQTTVADGRAVFDRLSDAAKSLLKARKLLYVRSLSAEDWPLAFRTTDPRELEQICHQNGMTLAMQPDGSIRTEYREDPLQQTRDGRESFINNALLLWQFEAAFKQGLAASLLGDLKEFPLGVRLDDGSPLPDWLMGEVSDAGEACTVELNWQDGDVVMLDNRWVLHGRRKNVGTDREILVRLGSLDPGPGATPAA